MYSIFYQVALTFLLVIAIKIKDMMKNSEDTPLYLRNRQRDFAVLCMKKNQSSRIIGPDKRTAEGHKTIYYRGFCQ